MRKEPFYRGRCIARAKHPLSAKQLKKLRASPFDTVFSAEFLMRLPAIRRIATRKQVGQLCSYIRHLSYVKDEDDPRRKTFGEVIDAPWGEIEKPLCCYFKSRDFFLDVVTVLGVSIMNAPPAPQGIDSHGVPKALLLADEIATNSE